MCYNLQQFVSWNNLWCRKVKFAILHWYLSIYETKLFLTFYKKPAPQRKRRTPALLNNSHVFCSSISKVVLKAVENTILLLEIHRTSKKLPLVETF